MIAGVVVCGNTGSVEAAFGESEGKVAAFASTGVGITAGTIWSGTGCSRLIDSMGGSANVGTTGNATSELCGISTGSSGSDGVSFAPSTMSLGSYVGHANSSTLSEISECACGAIAVTSVGSLIAETPAISIVCGISASTLSPFSPFPAACSKTGPIDDSASDSTNDT